MTQLQKRKTWRTTFPNVKISELVQVNELTYSHKSGKWVDLYKKRFTEKVRVIKLNTSHGEITRPIYKSVVLKTENCIC